MNFCKWKCKRIKLTCCFRLQKHNIVVKTKRRKLMERKVKIATIGGGSSYTPELMEGFIKRYEELPIKEIWLVDVAEGQEN